MKSLVSNHPRGSVIELEYDKNKTITSETRQLLTAIVAAEMVKLYS